MVLGRVSLSRRQDAAELSQPSGLTRHMTRPGGRRGGCSQSGPAPPGQAQQHGCQRREHSNRPAFPREQWFEDTTIHVLLPFLS